MGKKAEMGIGTLILFIAMILVAAVAAGVLLSTAIGLQSKALLTGKRTKDKVATQIQPIIVYAENGNNSNVEEFYAQLQLAPGSQPVKYNEMLIVLSTDDTSLELKLDTSRDCDNMTNGIDLTNATQVQQIAGKYFISEILSKDSNSDYLTRGEIVKVCFVTAKSDGTIRHVNEDEEVVLQFLPKVGNPVIMDLVMPSIINQERVVLYP